jgi:hypothetical protein
MLEWFLFLPESLRFFFHSHAPSYQQPRRLRDSCTKNLKVHDPSWNMNAMYQQSVAVRINALFFSARTYLESDPMDRPEGRDSVYGINVKNLQVGLLLKSFDIVILIIF